MISVLPKILLINKLEGETPLACLERLRKEKDIDQSVPMTYAGRLDPMAEGLLPILVGEECKKKDEYLGLDKEYEIEVLLGAESDTGDILGIVELGIQKEAKDHFSDVDIKKVLVQLVGTRVESYPAFSSKPVDGKPLFQWAKEGLVEELELPTKEITIYSIDFLSSESVSGIQIVESALERIGKVVGDFRQNEVTLSWKDVWGMIGDVQIIRLKVKCSSGAYMRTLSAKLGESLGTKALAWKIKRTKIGDYSLEP